MRKMSLLYKISFSAILIAIAVILSRFLSLPFYLFGLPFLKVSLATSVVMFASFYLGPVFGMIVGAGEDIIGSLLVQQGGAYNPLFTISVVLGGLIPWCIYKLFQLIKIDKKFPFSLTIIFVLICSFLTYFMIANDSIEYFGKTYVFEDWTKITVISTSWILSLAFIVFLFVIRKRFANYRINKYYNVFLIGTSIFITYAFFKVPESSLVFSLLYSYDFLVIFGARLLIAFLTAFIDLAINVVALNVSLRFSYKGALIRKRDLAEISLNDEVIKVSEPYKKLNVFLVLIAVLVSIVIVICVTI